MDTLKRCTCGRDGLSIPPERLLKAKVLQASSRCEATGKFCARLQTDLMFRWFIDLPLDEAAFDPSTFSQTRSVLPAPRGRRPVLFSRSSWRRAPWLGVQRPLLRRRHHDRRLGLDQELQTEGHAGKGPGLGNTWTDFKGHQRKNDTHASTTDPEAKLVRKGNGQEARLRFLGHATMENRNGCASCSRSRGPSENRRPWLPLTMPSN